MKTQKLVLLVTTIFILSLVSHFVFAEETEEKFVTKIDFGESVDRDEAIDIAKEFLLFKNIADQYFLTQRGVFPGYLVKEINGVWNAVFLKKQEGFKKDSASESIRIKINPDNGEVIDYETQQGFYLEGRYR